MIEIVFDIVVAIIDAIVAVIGSMIEAIASIFTAGGEALSAGEAIGALLTFIIEMLFWTVLWLSELLVAIFTFRRPHHVKKPKLWKPKNKKANDSGNNEGA